MRITEEQYQKILEVYAKLNHLGRSKDEQMSTDKKLKEELELKKRVWGAMK